VAFWQREDGSNPASEVLNAVRPGLATLDGQLLVISTPYAKAGPLWEAFDRYFGKDDDRVIVWKTQSRTMNSTIPERVVLDALERDEAAARAEWLAEFCENLAGFVSLEQLRACVVLGRTTDLDTLRDVDHLVAVDPATDARGGLRADDEIVLVLAPDDDEQITVTPRAVVEALADVAADAVARTFAQRRAREQDLRDVINELADQAAHAVVCRLTGRVD
jgi:hypothetical protein